IGLVELGGLHRLAIAGKALHASAHRRDDAPCGGMGGILQSHKCGTCAQHKAACRMMRHDGFPRCGAANYSPAWGKKHAEKLFLDRHNMPDPALAVAMGCIGRVMEQSIDRMTTISPLHLAAIAPDGGPI